MGHLLRIRGGGGAADTAEIGRVCGSDDYYEILGVSATNTQLEDPSVNRHKDNPLSARFGLAQDADVLALAL